MADKQLMERAEQALYKVYNRFPVVFDHGEGVKLYDTEGNEYLDFGAGIAVMALGYGDEEYTKAVEEQLHKLTHISNLFYNQPSIEAGEKLLQVSHMDKVFFTNSGTEAIEGALKIAKRYHYNKLHETMGDGCDGCEDAEPDMTGEIIAMNHSFHGRSLGALSVTGNAHYQEPFKPLIPGIRFADFNDLDSVKKLINSKTCAVIMETIQGEGGIYPATEEFLKGVRALCDEHDLLLILDEIQCGMGRSGEMFAWQHYGVKPDVMTVAKALGNGLPVGAFLAWGKAASAMVPGDHGTTYGGNPLASAVAGKVLDLINTPEMLNGVKQRHDWFVERLNSINHHYSLFSEVRGLGLLIGCVLNADYAGQAKQISQEAAKAGVMVLIAGGNVVRFAPALNVSEEEVTTGLDRFAAACEHFVSRGSS